MRRQASLRINSTDELDLTLEFRGERDGLRVYGTRQRIEFRDLPLGTLAEPPVAEVRAAGDEDEPSELYQALLEGTASSTGQDHHGTEMTEAALRGMAAQFNAGVDYLPSHWESEWDEVIGRTVDSEMQDGRVAVDGATGKPGDGKLLRVVVGLYKEEEKADKLVRVVRRKDRPVGMSIGGWFLDIEFLFDKDDNVERVLIHEVELDHLATTRNPSNREGWIDGLVERAVSNMRAQRSTALDTRTAPTPKPPAERHVVAVTEEEDTVTVVLGKSENFDGVTPLEGDTDEEEALTAPASVEARQTETVSSPVHDALDTSASASSTAPEPDAVQRAVPTQPNEPGADMPDDTTNAPETPEVAAPSNDERMTALERSVASLVTGMGALTAALTAQAEARAAEPQPPVAAAAPASAATVPQPGERTAADLERDNAELRARLERTVTAAGRVGMAAAARKSVELLAGGYKGLAARCKADLGENSAVAMVAERQAERRDAAKRQTPDRESLETDLRSLLAAAFADGIITDPAERSGWQ